MASQTFVILANSTVNGILEGDDPDGAVMSSFRVDSAPNMGGSFVLSGGYNRKYQYSSAIGFVGNETVQISPRDDHFTWSIHPGTWTFVIVVDFPSLPSFFKFEF